MDGSVIVVIIVSKYKHSFPKIVLNHLNLRLNLTLFNYRYSLLPLHRMRYDISPLDTVVFSNLKRKVHQYFSGHLFSLDKKLVKAYLSRNLWFQLL